MKRPLVSALLWTLCGLASAASAAPAITNAVPGPGVIRLEWDLATNRFIVARTDNLLNGKWYCVGSSTGTSARALTVPAPNATSLFFKVNFSRQAVTFPDPNLTRAVGRSIPAKLAPTNAIYDVELAKIAEVNASTYGITNLAGMPSLRNLARLILPNNRVGDTSTLVGMTNLTYLSLYGNRVTVPNLAGTPNLRELYLGTNGLTDVTFLGGLTKLQRLYLPRNPLANITPLSTLTALQYLDLSYSQVADLSPLANLKALHFLDLTQAKVTDLQPLIANAQQGGLGSSDAVYLSGNPLSSYAQTNQVPMLRSTYKVIVSWP